MRAIQRKEEKLRHLEGELAKQAPHQPMLCRTSQAMAEAMRSGSFLERVSAEVARKEHEAMRMKARLARDPECTFAPAINPASKALKGRSAVELSRGDQLRRETAHRLMRLRTEAEQLEGVTFAPAINDRSRAVEGRLRVLSEPHTYVQRLSAEAAAAAEKARQAAAEASSAALDECTFKPEVHAAPEYVTRIARSMALARAVRPPPPGPSKPEWR
jgi:hypothetical protein